jgi:RNA polymerase sigma-70 factor (ECF subfamily)
MAACRRLPLTHEVDEMESQERTEKCKEIFSLLSEYLDLELPPGACQEIERHIAACPPCIEFAESLRKTVELCRGYRPTELPEPMGKEAREQLLGAYRKVRAARGGS